MISLERHNSARRMHRYYRLTVERNLFGEWSLVREWGRIGQPGLRMIDLTPPSRTPSRDGAQGTGEAPLGVLLNASSPCLKHA